MVRVDGGLLRTPPFLTPFCSVWSGLGFLGRPPVVGARGPPSGVFLAGVCSFLVWAGWSLSGPGGVPRLVCWPLSDPGGLASLPLSGVVAVCGGGLFGGSPRLLFPEPPFFFVSGLVGVAFQSSR